MLLKEMVQSCYGGLYYLVGNSYTYVCGCGCVCLGVHGCGCAWVWVSVCSHVHMHACMCTCMRMWLQRSLSAPQSGTHKFNKPLGIFQKLLEHLEVSPTQMSPVYCTFCKVFPGQLGKVLSEAFQIRESSLATILAKKMFCFAMCHNTASVSAAKEHPPPPL